MRLFPSKRLLRRHDRTSGSRRRLIAGLLLLTAGVGLVVIGQVYPTEVADARSRLAGPVSSILAIVQAPLKPLAGLRQRYDDFFAMESELARLRAENEELKGWQWRAIELERQLADLSALNKVVSEPGLDYVTTRVIAHSFGAGSRSVLIAAGENSGVSAGAAVFNQRGLAGVAFEVGPATSRVLFVNDMNARVLVSIGRGLVSAEVVGTGGADLEIRDGGRTFDIAVGDEVMTAGEEGGVPRGLRVGRVVATPRGLRVAPYVDFDRLEFVSVLLPGQNRPAGHAGEGGGSARLTAELGKDGEGFGAAPDSGVAAPVAETGRRPQARRDRD